MDVQTRATEGHLGGEIGGRSRESSEIADRAHDSMEDASESLARIDRSVRAFTAEQPVAAIFGALAFGYVLGRVLSRV